MTGLSSNIRRIFLPFQVLKHPDKKFRIGQALKATVVGPDSSKAFLCLSLIGVVMKWDLVREGRGWKGAGRGLQSLPRLKDAVGFRVLRKPSVVAMSLEQFFSRGFALWLVSESPLPTQLFFLGLSERLVHHMALAFLTTWHGDLGLCDRSGPLSLDSPSLDASTSPRLWLASVSASFLAHFLFPESGSFSCQVLTSSRKGKWPWAAW